MRYLASSSLLIVAIAAASAAQQSLSKQTIAPHELRAAAAPPPIIWDTPPLPAHPINFESAEERNLRLDVLARGLEQPWSLVFLPDGSILIAERPGRIRRFHNGVLDAHPVRGVPPVQTGGKATFRA